MLSEIGSNFWLDPNQSYKDLPLGTPEQFNCKGSDYAWLSTGRSSIKFVIKTIEERQPIIKKIAVLPSFTCNTVYEPFLKLGYEIYYYPVGKDLRTTAKTILKTVFDKDASIVLFHRYFGFDTLDNQVDAMCQVLRGLGKYSIEDCTQCLYSDIPRADSDFIVGSIRKWAGTPDGGFAVCRDGFLNNKPQNADTDLEQYKIKASYAKYYYLFNSERGKEKMLTMFRAAEDYLDKQEKLYEISDMSKKVQSNLDVKELVNKRKNNYHTLFEGIKHTVTPLFTFDVKREVPLYFPILVNDRSSLQNYLAKNRIYAPIVWPKDDKQLRQCEGAENAYKHLLCIPIDQRYDVDDMNRIISVINLIE